MNKKERIFFDHASTTPLAPEVFKAMKPFLTKDFANPSAIYKEGVYSRKVIDDAKKNIAGILNAHQDEIFFTGSGTESDNLAILGTLSALTPRIKNPHIVVSQIEHPAILEVVSQLEEKKKIKVTRLPVDEFGNIDPKDVLKSLTNETILVSCMYANNEIGTIEPISEIAKVIRLFRKRKINNNDLPYFHTDASQAGNYLHLNVSLLHVDLLTLDGSKIYGPKGVGVLFVRRGISISPIILGGGQEKGLRSGTENVSHIVGMSEAFTLVQRDKEMECQRLSKLRDYLIKKVLKHFAEATLNGDAKNRLANNVNICFPGLDSEFCVLQLDEAGISVSSSSSCSTLSESAGSYVIKALGKGNECSESSLRITFGRGTSKKDVDALLTELKKIIKS